MKISITDRLQAFSHNPGHEVMLPGTHVKVKVFPTCLECIDLSNQKKGSFSWDLKGPIFPFTVEQDLERSCIRIYGDSVQGYFRFVLKANESKAILVVEKVPEGTLLSKEKVILLEDVEIKKEIPLEKLFLGNSKQKDVDFMRRRRDLSEILPFWFFLGQMTPSLEEEKGVMSDLLDQMASKIENKDKSVEDLFLITYLAGLSSGFVPRGDDSELRGLVPVEVKKELTAISLLSKGALLIRSLFFQEKEGAYHFLPCLPSSFPAGKMIGLGTSDGNLVDIEWTKHQMRRVCIKGQKEGQIVCSFPFGVKRYRARRSLKEKGTILQAGEALSVKPGDIIWLDCFQT